MMKISENYLSIFMAKCASDSVANHQPTNVFNFQCNDFFRSEMLQPKMEHEIEKSSKKAKTSSRDSG